MTGAYCNWSFTFSNPLIDALVVDAGRAGHADAADDVVAGLDRLAAGNGDDVRQRHLLVRDRSGIQKLLGVFRRRLLEGHRGVGLAPRVLHGVRRGGVGAHRNDRLAVAIDDHGGGAVALGVARRDRAFGDGLGDVERQVLVHDERGAGGKRRGEQAGDGGKAETMSKRHCCVSSNGIASAAKLTAGAEPYSIFNGGKTTPRPRPLNTA